MATATNEVNGLARITTGTATAAGNSATTTVVQVVEVLGGGVAAEASAQLAGASRAAGTSSGVSGRPKK